MDFSDLAGKPFRRQIAQERFAHQGEDDMAGLHFKAASDKEYKRITPGSHLAVCDIVADLGLQETFFGTKRRLYVRFEVPGERWEYEKDGKQMEGPGVIGFTETASMNKKANLRKKLEGWRGRSFTDQEAEQFDITSILGKAAMINVQESSGDDGKTYSNVVGIMPIPKGVPAPKAELPLLLYHEGDKSQLSRLPEWIQKKINEQIPEPDEMEDVHSVDRREDTSFNPEITDDDIPW